MYVQTFKGDHARHLCNGYFSRDDAGKRGCGYHQVPPRQLPDVLRDAPAGEARAVAKQVIDRIEFDFQHDKKRGTAQRKKYQCTGGAMKLNVMNTGQLPWKFTT